MDELWKNVIVSREHMNAEYLRKVVSFPPLQAGLALGIGCSSVLFAHSFFLYKSGYYATRRFVFGFIIVTPISVSMYITRYKEKAALLSAHMRKNGPNGPRQLPSTDAKKW